MFPTEFWLELARLEGIRYSPRSRPLRWGKYIMAFVYDAVDSDVGNTLRELNCCVTIGETTINGLSSSGDRRSTITCSASSPS